MNAITLAELATPLEPSKVPFEKYGIARLVSSQCTFSQAEYLYFQGCVTKREFDRYKRIWGNSTFRLESKSQDLLFAIGGLAAVDRRYSRTKKLHEAWRKQVLISIAKDCLDRRGI